MELDYVVVGAGASGCAVAHRLSEDPSAKVLLLELGGRASSWAMRVPRAFPFALRPPYLISYPTQPRGPARTPGYWVRGTGLGGSTSVNGMMYLRGEPAAYDDLAAAGNPGWGWEAFGPAFGEIERLLRPSVGALNPLSERLVDALAHDGAARVRDLNQTTGPRAGPTPATIHRGARRSAADAFLAPLRLRENVHVLTGVRVGRILWQGTRAIGVRVVRSGQKADIFAPVVVLCAGTIETPLLLERSGVGRPDLLATARIDLRVPSPRVGEGIREQQGQSLRLSLKPGVPGSTELATPGAVAIQALRYALTHRGALARPAYDVTALLSSAGEGGPVDVQVMAIPFALDPGGALRPDRSPGVTLAGYPIRPTTTSSIHVDPRSPDGPPMIDERFEHTQADVAANKAVGSALRRIAESPALGRLTRGHEGPGRGSAASGPSVYHAVGSAAMGPNDEDVVDSRLRVRGTAGLRIADLSVLPFHTSGSTAAPAMAIGWLAGDLLREPDQ